MLQNSSSRIASVYLAFAKREARGRSPVYEGLARAIANDSVALSFLAQLPRAKQQPNLLFAAVKYLYGTRTDWDSFRHLLLQYWDEIKATIMARSTQTNEPARCATLIPLFSLLPPPLALLEVGAAAGLCLLPDAYGYDYEGHRVAPSLLTSAAAPTFRCRASRAPLLKAGVDIIWRAGLDLRPIDIKDPEQVAWLEALVWPDEGNRVELLRAALKVAQQYPLRLVQGDLRTDIRNLVAQMPKDATRVIFHTAVMGYLSSAADRSAFAQTIRDLNVVWVSNEAPELSPDVSQEVPKPWPLGRFLLSMNRRPIAWTDPHGTSFEWIADFRAREALLRRCSLDIKDSHRQLHKEVFKNALRRACQQLRACHGSAARSVFRRPGERRPAFRDHQVPRRSLNCTFGKLSDSRAGVMDESAHRQSWGGLT